MGGLALLLAIPAITAQARGLHGETWARERFVRAERMRETLGLKIAKFRTPEDYQDAINAYRRVYYGAPSSAKADASAYAVAQLLVEMGRQFDDSKLLRSGISQYEFVRREYPYSKYRFDALYAIADIYKFDLDDPAAARSSFGEFLRKYPRHHLADDAKAAIAELDQAAAQENAKSLAKKIKESKKVSAAEQPAAETNTSSDQDSGVQSQASTVDTATVAKNNDEKPSGTPHVTGVRHWTTADYTRIAIDVDQEVKFDSQRIDNPDRIFFDLHNTSLISSLKGKSFEVDDGFLKKIRVAQFKPGRALVVLEVEENAEYSAFYVEKPSRLIIDVHGKNYVKSLATKESTDQSTMPPAKPAPQQDSDSGERNTSGTLKVAVSRTPAPSNNQEVRTSTLAASGTKSIPKKIVEADDDDDDDTAASSAAGNESKPVHNPVPASKKTTTSAAATSGKPGVTRAKSKRRTADGNNDEVATLESNDPQPDNADSKPANKIDVADLDSPDTSPKTDRVTPTKIKAKRNRTADIEPVVHEAVPTASGDRSLIRALGLKIGRIVIDPGHGGHDTGTIGPNGLQEKDLVLDVGRRLGKLLETRLGADVVYTRQDDTFIPLETRTAIANQEQADLFVSIHANSSRDPDARGVETYYLNFTSSAEALEVAARENAVSDKSIHELQDLVKKIALKEKIEESREFASDVQHSLHTGLSAKSPGLRDRGVKKAPFIVLIGANMPSILAEVSFVSNPTDERKLETAEYRQRIAESLYRGVSKYVGGLSGVKVASRMSKTESP